MNNRTIQVLGCVTREHQGTFWQKGPHGSEAFAELPRPTTISTKPSQVGNDVEGHPDGGDLVKGVRATR